MYKRVLSKLDFEDYVPEPIKYNDIPIGRFAAGNPALVPLGNNAEAFLNANLKVAKRHRLRKSHVNGFRYQLLQVILGTMNALLK